MIQQPGCGNHVELLLLLDPKKKEWVSESYQVALVRTARGGPVTSGAAYLISFPGTELGGAGRRDVE